MVGKRKKGHLASDPFPQTCTSTSLITLKLNMNYTPPGPSPIPTCREACALVDGQPTVHLPRIEVPRLVFRLVDWL